MCYIRHQRKFYFEQMHLQLKSSGVFLDVGAIYYVSTLKRLRYIYIWANTILELYRTFRKDLN